MKIIKPGDIGVGARRFTCPKCGCIFVAEKDEYNAHRFFAGEVHYVAKCPTCGEYTWNSEAVTEDDGQEVGR